MGRVMKDIPISIKVDECRSDKKCLIKSRINLWKIIIYKFSKNELYPPTTADVA